MRTNKKYTLEYTPIPHHKISKLLRLEISFQISKIGDNIREVPRNLGRQGII